MNRKAIALVMTPLGGVYNEAYLTLKEREQKRASQNKEAHEASKEILRRWEEEDAGDQNDNLNDAAPFVVELKPYVEPTVKEIISTAFALLSLDKPLDKHFQRVADSIRSVEGNGIEVFLEETECSINDIYPEQTLAAHKIVVDFPASRKVQAQDDDGNFRVNEATQKAIMTDFNQVTEVMEKLKTTGYPFVLQ